MDKEENLPAHLLPISIPIEVNWSFDIAFCGKSLTLYLVYYIE